ncbi:MAG: sugar transferase [Kiritimatiellae bacterium]|nr:sugar transferase [Kiritimatiellia bacterium]
MSSAASPSGATRVWPGGLRVLLLMTADLACLVAVWALVVWGYRALGFGHYKYGAGFYFTLWPAGVVFLATNALFRLYHGSVFYPSAPVNPVEEFRRLVGSAVLTHVGVIAALAIAYQSTEHYSRAVILISGMLTAMGVQLVRNVLRWILKKLDVAQIPVVLIGTGETAQLVGATLAQDAYTGFRVALEADVAVVCEDMRIFKCEMSELTRTYRHIVYVPSGASFPVFGAQAVAFDGLAALEMLNQRRMLALRVEKWLLDKLLAVIAFVLLLPFFVVVPVLIKLTSRGPVFYRQNRLGRGGQPIRVWKFRSMYADADARLASILASDPAKKAEWEANFKLADDPRVTPLGRFLRKTSIDEFPQLFNVFAGDMALVGPRPIVSDEVKYYGAAYDIFASVHPGVTGLWQASGRSGTDYARRVALDTYYVLNWSPWMDVWILFRTVGAVLFMRGAC